MSFSTRYGSSMTGLANLQADLMGSSFSLNLGGGGALPTSNNAVANLGNLQAELGEILSMVDQYYEEGHRFLIDAVLEFALSPKKNIAGRSPFIGIEQSLSAAALDGNMSGPLDYMVNRDFSARVPANNWGAFTGLSNAQKDHIAYPNVYQTQIWRLLANTIIIEAKRNLFRTTDDTKYEGQLLAQMTAMAYQCQHLVGAGGEFYLPGILTDGVWYKFYEVHMPAAVLGDRACTFRRSADFKITNNLQRIVSTLRDVFDNLATLNASKF